jgi:hypothetical protein
MGVFSLKLTANPVNTIFIFNEIIVISKGKTHSNNLNIQEKQSTREFFISRFQVWKIPPFLEFMCSLYATGIDL